MIVCHSSFTFMLTKSAHRLHTDIKTPTTCKATCHRRVFFFSENMLATYRRTKWVKYWTIPDSLSKDLQLAWAVWSQVWSGVRSEVLVLVHKRLDWTLVLGISYKRRSSSILGSCSLRMSEGWKMDWLSICSDAEMSEKARLAIYGSSTFLFS